MPVVLVISADWQLRALVRAELKEAGLMAIGLDSADSLEQDVANFDRPSVIVLDGTELEKAAVRAQIAELAQDAAVLAVESRISAIPEIPGVAVLRRPLRVKEIVSWVREHVD